LIEELFVTAASEGCAAGKQVAAIVELGSDVNKAICCAFSRPVVGSALMR